MSTPFPRHHPRKQAVLIDRNVSVFRKRFPKKHESGRNVSIFRKRFPKKHESDRNVSVLESVT